MRVAPLPLSGALFVASLVVPLLAGCGGGASEDPGERAPSRASGGAEVSEASGAVGGLELEFPPLDGKARRGSSEVDAGAASGDGPARVRSGSDGSSREGSEGKVEGTSTAEASPAQTAAAPRAPRPAGLGADEPTPLESDVEGIIADAIRVASKASRGKANGANCAVAMMAVDVDSGAVLVRRLAELPLVPASNLKLMTVAAALAGLGPDGQFRTPFEAHGEVVDGVLKGDLVVRAGGDPLYRADGDGGLGPWLGGLKSSLNGAGIQRVSGALVLDEGTWLTPGPGPDWPAAVDHWQMYCALAAGFTVNAGSFRAQVTPRPERGAVDVILRPRHHGLTRRGKVKLGSRNAVNVGANASGVTVKGTIPGSSSTLVTEFSAPDPVDLFGHAVVGGLGDLGLSIDGGYVRRRGVEPAAADPSVQVVHTIQTPILEVFRPILEDSHNSVADQLFFALGHQTQGEGSRNASAQAVRQALEKLGVLADGLVQVDGSGLSKANRTNATQLVALVAALVKTGGPTAEAFLDALPLAGKTGSLSKRMRGTPAESRVRAKTGWVQGTSALSGLATTVEGRRVVFSILVSYPRVSGLNTKAWKPMQDRLCEALVLWESGQR